jgi:arylsulfatase A-like enzyme
MTTTNTHWTSISIVLLISTIGCAAPKNTPKEDTPEKPNVVFIVIDSLRADALSSYGYERKTSPRIDAFAEENIRFSQTVSVAASTGPSVAAMLNGRLPFYVHGTIWSRHSLYGMTRFYEHAGESGLPRNPASLPEMLQNAGYTTIGLVTNGHLARTANFDQGFDFWGELFSAPVKPYGPADQLTELAIECLLQVKEAPFFLYLHYMDVHYPYLPPEEFQDRFDFKRVANMTDVEIQERWLQETDLDSPEHQHIAEHARGLYDGEIAFTDYWIGRLLDWLDQQGYGENTIVVITADHGEEFLDHGNTIHKAKMYEELVHVPLAIRIPGIDAARIDDVVRNFDVMPTILDYCGIETESMRLDAASLRPLIEGFELETPQIAFASFPAGSSREAPTHRQMIRMNRYKLLLDLDDPTASNLFDLQHDPGEKDNRFNDLKEERATLMRHLENVIRPLKQETDENIERRAQRGEPVGDGKGTGGIATPETSQEVIDQLEALGYVD